MERLKVGGGRETRSFKLASNNMGTIIIGSVVYFLRVPNRIITKNRFCHRRHAYHFKYDWVDSDFLLESPGKYKIDHISIHTEAHNKFNIIMYGTFYNHNVIQRNFS
jgi:hypothetical protein